MNARVLGWVKERLSWENWEKHLPRLVRYAERVIKNRMWRGNFNGVLPGGYDAESIAMEVIESALEGKSGIALGWTTERLERGLRRGVRNKVRVLQARKESAVVRNEWDVLPPSEEDELQSVFEDIPAEPMTDVKKVLANEAAAKGLEERIEGTLHGTDRDAEKVFSCMREGVVKPRKIATQLGMSVKGVTNCAKRLRRTVKKIWKERVREKPLHLFGRP